MSADQPDFQAVTGMQPALCRNLFELPDGIIYLDGNSLGALPKATKPRLEHVVRNEWGDDLIAGWTKHGWIDAPAQVAGKLARLVGAEPSELLITDSTSVSLFKLLAAAVLAGSGRTVVLTEQGNFPTDLYVAQGLCDMLGITLRRVPREALGTSLDDSVAVLMLTHVDFRSGEVHDMAELSAAARSAGAINLWDLSHSAGAVELDLDGAGCDLAVGCGYKYLNGGPGAPAFTFVSEALQDRLQPPLQGWMGHADPFAFAPEYRPANGIQRFSTGTPPILALAALECGIATFDGLAMADIAAASRALSQRFVTEIESRCGNALKLLSPRDPMRRGSQLSFAHREGYAVMQALIANGVVGDFRAPDLIRFGFAPLYNSEEEVVRAAEILAGILERHEWDRPRYHARSRVT